MKRFATIGILLLATALVKGQSTVIYSYSVPSVGGYDANSNLLQYTDQMTGTWTMQYDGLNRLQTATASAGYANGLALAWLYDSFGNRLTQTLSGSSGISLPQSTTFRYGSNNQMWENNSSGPRMVDSSGNVVSGVVHDGAGNVMYDGTNQMVYDGENRLCASQNTLLGGSIVQYLYNAEGQRVAKGHPTTGNALACPDPSNFTPTATYVLGPSGEQVTELDGQGVWQHSNVYGGGQMIATYDSNGLHFPFTDPLGTKRIQTSAAGAVELTCFSLPFGDGPPCGIPAGAPSSADVATEHRFTGKERDTESGLDYFGARYYASSMGRWMSPDWSKTPMGVPYAKLDNPQSLNLYSYVGNNPLIRIDADGHCWSWLQGLCNTVEKAYHGIFTDYGFKTNAQVSQVNEQNRQWLIQNNVVTPDKNGNTIDWNKANAGQVRTAYAATVGAMVLRLIHGPETISGAALDSVRKMSTEDIIESLKSGQEPGIIKPDGSVMNGNTRLTVLQERGVDINSLGLKPDPMYSQFSEAEAGASGAAPMEEAPATEAIPSGTEPPE